MYTADQIDRGGYGMRFHPVTRDELTLLQFDDSKKQFFKLVCGGTGWGMKSCTPRREYLRRIGDGNPRRPGNLLSHMHWKFDPFTGRSLEPWVSTGGLWDQD